MAAVVVVLPELPNSRIGCLQLPLNLLSAPTCIMFLTVRLRLEDAMHKAEGSLSPFLLRALFFRHRSPMVKILTKFARCYYEISITLIPLNAYMM